MRKIFSTLAIVLLVVLDASAAIIKVTTRNFTSEPTMRRRTTLTLADPSAVTASPWLIAGDSVAAYTDTNGIAWYSNVLAAKYRLDIAGSPGRSFPMAVFDTNGILDAAILVNSTNYNAAYYTSAQVDALIGSGSGGTSGALTNNEARAVTFADDLTVSGGTLTLGTSSSENTIQASAGVVTFSQSLGVNGPNFTAGNIIGTNFVGNGSGLTNLTSAIAADTVVSNAVSNPASLNATNKLHTDMVADLAAGSYPVKIPTSHGITIWAEYANDGQFIGPNIYAGHPQNHIKPGEVGCFIAGGITNTTSGAAYTNTILDRISTIAGGVGNWIGENSEGSFIGAGEQNRIGDDCTHSVIVSGEINTIEGLAEWSGILSGHHVAIVNGAGYAVMLGGDRNTNSGAWGTMGGGEYNLGSGLHTVVMGGQSNVASGAYSQIGGGFLNSQSGWAGAIVGNRVTNALNGGVSIGFHTNTLTVQSNGTVSTTGQFVGNGTGLTNLLISYTVQAGGTVATLPDSTALLNFGTTDPSMTITAAGTYMIQAGTTLQYNAWEPDINPSTVTIKVRKTSGSPDDISGANVNFDLATTGAAYTGPLMVVTTPMVIYTSAGSETIQLWGDRGSDPVGGSIEARSAWITAIRIR